MAAMTNWRRAARGMAAALAVMATVWPHALEAQELDREAVEMIVREYILDNPEIVEEAIIELRRRRDVAQAEALRENIRSQSAALYQNDQSPVMGDAEGAVTVVEFADYRCGFCRRMAPALMALMEERPDLRFVVKEFPVLGPDSEMAARAALTLRDDPRFEEFHFALMTTPEINEDSVLAAASSLGIDTEAMRAEMDDPAIDEIIQKNYDLAQALGITGTPAYVIGETLIPGAAYEEVIAAIDAEYANLPQ